MTKLKLVIIFFIIIYCNSNAQVSNDTILKFPKQWRYEKVKLPFGFAPQMTYTGVDELRFAPGMFNRASDTYFTYAYVMTLDNEPHLLKQDIEKLLYEYYRGLCGVVAKSKNIDVNLSKITIDLNPLKNNTSYSGQVVYFDTFNNGEQVILHTELEVITNTNQNKSYIIGLVSPAAKDSKIWKILKDIKSQIKL